MSHSRPDRIEATAGGCGRAFTLIEVLVVVAIIALLVAILVPSLAAARESARAAQCLSGLKQLASATHMYATDHKSVLPGPLHPMIFRETYDAFYRSRDADEASGGFYRRAHLVYYIRKYFSEKSRTGDLSDRVSTCPTGEGLASTNIKKIIEAGGWSGYAGYRPFSYIVNSAMMDTASTGSNGSGPPYHGTKPPFYFGVIYHGYTLEQWAVPVNAAGQSQFDVNNGLKPGYRVPKKLESILRPGKEWMQADAWYGEVDLGSEVKPGGTWPYKQGNNSSLSPNGLMMIPTWAYHNTRRTYMMTIDAAKADKNPNSPRFREGRTNASYMDGHGEGARGWRGVGNPCMPNDLNCS